MKQYIIKISFILCLSLTFTACGQVNAEASVGSKSVKGESKVSTQASFDGASPDFDFVNEMAGFGFADDLLADAYKHVETVEEYYTEQLFTDEDAVKKETINSEDVINIKLQSVYGAVYVETSPDADIHLEYPEEAHFTISHETKDGDLTISAKVSTPSNYDILKVYIPLETIKQLDITEGASSIHLVGQEGMLESLNIEAALATVYLENIYADTKVKTGTGTIRMSNDTIKSDIHLITKTGVIDVGLGELPDDVSIYTNGNSVSNSVLGGRDSVSPHEKYAIALENSVGGINVHKEER